LPLNLAMTNQPKPQTVIATNPRIEVRNQGQVLSFNLTAANHTLGRDPQSNPPEGMKIPEDWFVVSRFQACFRKSGKNYFIYDGDGEKPSTNRLFINNKLITPKDGYCLQNGDEIKVGQNPQNWVTIVYFDPNSQATNFTPKSSSIYLKNKTITIGRDPGADLELDAPTISRRHATIELDPQGRYMLKDRSTNGIFVNRQKVDSTAILENGSIVQIGPYTFVLQGDELALVDRGSDIRLDAKNIVLTVKDKNKQKIRLLNDISLAIEPGQLVALVGGSGAGKSTLMKSLLGIEPKIEGTVYLNGDNLKTNFNIYRTLIGYVPQQDIVHTNLRVREVLYYAAKLRLPPDINVQQVVDKTLQQIELVERQNNLVKNLSGGQLKRVSIGVELLADPKLFFLDEPTSGLDPGLDKKMMQLLRKLANEGRTIVLVTHATTNITLCDRIVFLGLGGNLCYFGPPDRTAEFFQIDRGDFADIYIQLETKEAVADESERYRNSEYKKEYIDDRLSEITQEKNFTPKPVQASFLRQLIILVQRYIQLILRDPVYLALALITAPIGVALMTLALKDNEFLLKALRSIGEDKPITINTERAGLARRVLFIFTSASLWVGFASSLQEIVKESAIYLRERLVNLGLFAYLGSKVLTLSGLAIIQSLLIALVAIVCFKSPEVQLTNFNPESPFISIPWFVGVFITTFFTIIASSSLGLMVSASVKNSTQANSALPLLLLPQIIFAGILFDVEKGGAISKYISYLMVSRWSVAAYGSLASINDLIPVDESLSKTLYKLQMFESSAANITLSWCVLLIHACVYLLITFWLQKCKDILK
jgi:ABC transport system ATP-binding/permease protein